MKQITVTFDIDEKQEEALLELLPFWQQYTSKEDGRKPFADYTIEEVLQSVMYCGSKHRIWKAIKEEQFRQEKLSTDELLDMKQLTIAEREEDRRQQAQKEGGAE